MRLCLSRGRLLFHAAILYTLWMGTRLQVCQAAIYTNEWAIRIRADLETVNRIAERHGFSNMGQVGAIALIVVGLFGCAEREGLVPVTDISYSISQFGDA